MTVKKQKYKFKKMLGLSVLSIFITLIAVMFILQYSKYSSLKKQKAELLNELYELKLEEQRLKLFLSYEKGRSFADDYARNNLGYVGPNDIILNSDR